MRKRNEISPERIPFWNARILLTISMPVWYIESQGRFRVHMVFAALPRATTPSFLCCRFISLLFSCCYKTLFQQLLSFHIYTKRRGWGGNLFPSQFQPRCC